VLVRVGVGLCGVGVIVGVIVGVCVLVLVLEGVGLIVLVGDGDTGGPGSHACPSEQLPSLVKTRLISVPVGSNPQIYLVSLESSDQIIGKLCGTLLQSL